MQCYTIFNTLRGTVEYDQTKIIFILKSTFFKEKQFSLGQLIDEKVISSLSRNYVKLDIVGAVNNFLVQEPGSISKL